MLNNPQLDAECSNLYIGQVSTPASSSRFVY